MEGTLYKQDGEKAGIFELPENLFGVRWNGELVRQTLLALQASRRRGTAHAKGRSEVRGGGKKPWRQKGTGRARHGSIRSPIWIGGGVTHGPTSEKIYEKKVNKKARRIALGAVLSKKLKEGEIVFLDKLEMPEAKTKMAVSILKKLSASLGIDELGKRGAKTLVLIDTPKADTIRSLRNLPFVDVEESRNLNLEKALTPKYLIFTKDAVFKITA